MANYVLCGCLFRIALPLLILTCVAFRPSILSAIYLLLLLYSAIVPVPTPKSMAGHTGIYLKILIALSILGFLLQLAFQIVLLSIPPYGHFLINCEMPETILTYCGFVRLDAASGITITTWIAPEIVMTISAIGLYIFCKKLTATNVEIESEQGELPQKTKPKRNTVFWMALGKYLALSSLCLAAVLRPSVPGGFYFLIFIGSCTWWACNKQLERGFAIVCRIVMAVAFLHIVSLYAYQFDWAQEQLDPSSPYARYFGLIPIFNTSCETPRDIELVSMNWDGYANPLALIWLFYILALVSKNLLKPKVHPHHEDTTNERTPLMRGASPSRKYGSGSRRGHSNILQDSTGSVTVTGENPDDIPLQNLEDEEEKPGCFENTIFIMESILQFIIQSSYVATNIIMMTWSITYHSWLTFLLLLWANILWMLPNQRKATLRSSPFLVFYATFLLLSGYVYCMDAKELPNDIYGFSLAQIGLIRITEYPCHSLLIKCLYTMMFWITLRQNVREIKEARQSHTLADMAAPLQVTVGAATGVTKEQEKETQLLKKIGEHLKKFFTTFWIWVVAITLFAVAITGERMTGFRIIYMALFLFFIITFQLSFRLWMKVMFAFWLTVIIYSMIILILVYTYQFDNFSQYWTEYLGISETLQLDIGLENYGSTQLFVRLATPTFFVIVTVVQLHYFHKDFMLISTPTEETVANPTSEEASSAQGKVLEQKDRDDTDKSDITSLKIDLTDLGNLSTEHIKYKLSVYWNKMYKAINFIFVFLEIHMHKFVLLMAILMSIYDKCALYIFVVLLVVLSITTTRKLQLFVIYASSVFASFLLLARMVFQIQAIDYNFWNVSCTDINLEGNDASWLGFNKTVTGRDLPRLVRWNIAYVSAVTLYTIVLIRQFNYKKSRGKPTTRFFFMFPGVDRLAADKNLKTCLKYLANYGYYKFGVEISLMATVALIGYRMDLYALLYGIWLAILFSLRRAHLAKVWNFYLGFIAVFIGIQYVMVIGLPPTLCTAFPWDNSVFLRRFQEWAFLLDYASPPPAKKLIFDVILLLFVSRQAVVFRIEKRYKNQDYPGGSNESIIHHAEENNFVNPLPDFITFTRSYLDVAKRIILLGFMWLTLAIVFLAGANRVNTFAVGYLIGSFIFLWQGSDIYLKPIDRILKSWNWLLGYNVAVILCKTILQFLGCVYLSDEMMCWVAQLLGIGCVKECSSGNDINSVESPLPKHYIGLVWDGICFGFLIMQRRIFCSYNFFHMIDETKATTILASRGADLIEQLRDKRMHEQDEQERRILEKIKAKMDRIKATQQKLQGPDHKTTTSHYVDDLYPKSRPLYRRRIPNTYKEAIRSGDYYMFDELDDDEDLEMIEELKLEDEEEEDEEQAMLKRRGSTKRTIGEIEESPQRGDRSERSGRLKIEESEPRPGTSKDEEFSDISEPKDSKCQKVMDILIFIWACIDSFMVSMINYLNKFSRDYRYVVKVLRQEKKLLKQSVDYTQGLRIGRGQVWQPAGSYHTLLQKSRPEQQMIIPKFDEYETGELSTYDQPTIVRLALTIWYIVLSHSDILCYFVIFLNQIKSATFLSLPLPLMVFLWGTLTVPRPSKNFWVTIIAYTQMIVLIKCLFQFPFLPWNKVHDSLNPMNPAKLFGVEQRVNYALWDLLLLLIVFFHRYLLKCLGLWKTTAMMVPAYTDGQYMVDEVGIAPLRREHEQSPELSYENGQPKHRNISISERKDSDLQRLVEESEDAADDQTDVEQTDRIEYSGMDNVVSLEVKDAAPYDMFPDTIQMNTSKYVEAIKDFFIQLKDPTSRVAVDVYSYMFMCDFFNFFVILIGYSSFGTQQGDGGVSSYLQDDRVPTLFLLMLILQFTLILVDRAIFLRKNIVAKIIFQFVQIIVLHIWLFVLFPAMTDRAFNSVIPPQMYYMVKCFYLLLSSYQIRCGYPSRILGNFLCKGYNYLNMFLFKGFMLIPFLFELRTVMDWMWTDTSMTVFDWIKMEDIFAHIFQLKCVRHVETEYPQPRGERKSPRIKYMMGGAILFVIVAIIWFPLVFFSLGNAVGQPNPPIDVTLDLRIGPYEPVYHLSAQSNAIFLFKQQGLKDLLALYKADSGRTAFISNYEAPDIAAVKLSQDSSNVWGISPPDRDRMIAEIKSDSPITIRLQYIVTHKSNNKDVSGVIREETSVVMTAMVNNKTNPERLKLLAMLGSSKNETITPVLLDYIFPKFIKVTNRGTALPVPQMMQGTTDPRSKELRQLTLMLSKSPDNPELEWWEIAENCTDNDYKYRLKNISYSDCNSIMLYTFNDRMFPETLNFFTAGGIIGLYTTLVFVISRLLRGFFSEICFKIMFDDMPNVDRVLQLCHDIYLVREAREFYLEEDLFAKLVFLYRSPETLIKWTRPKEELADDEDPEGEPE